MSLLERMRRSTDSTTMRVIFGVVVLFFIFWGAGGSNNNRGGNEETKAIVGGTHITSSQLYREMRLRDRGGAVTEEDQARLQREVLDQLIQEELLIQEARRLGIEVSEKEYLRVLAEQDLFKKEGKFSEDLFEKQLKRMGLNQPKYHEQVVRQLLINKLLFVVGGAAQVPEAEVKRQYVLDNTTVDLTWVRVPQSALLDDVPVTDAETDAYLAGNELKVKERYDQDFERLYRTPRKAVFSVILLRNDLPGVELPALKVQASKVRELALGADDAGFAELAKTYSEDLTGPAGGDMGNMPEPLMDPPLAAAIFAAGPGKVTEVAETGRGLWIARVRAVEEAKETPFDQVKRAIAHDLVAQERVVQVTQEYAEKVLAAWKAGDAAPADLLGAQGLTVASTGPTPLGRFAVQELGPNPGLQAAVQSSKGVGPLPSVYPTPGGWVVGAISQWVPADEARYAEERDAVLARVQMSTRARLFEAWLEDLRKNAKVEDLLAKGPAPAEGEPEE